MSTKAKSPGPSAEDDKRSKIAALLSDRDFQNHLQVVLKRHFPRFDPAKDVDPAAVNMKLIHRDAAESFIEHLYETISVPRKRHVLTPKQIIR